MLVQNINWYVCDCAEEIYSTYVPESIQIAELCVNTLKDNIKMDLEEIALMTTRTENNLIII